MQCTPLLVDQIMQNTLYETFYVLDLLPESSCGRITCGRVSNDRIFLSLFGLLVND